MTAETGDGFRPGVILAVAIVGVVAFCGLMTLLAYAPDLRGDSAGRANALSKSAIGFAGLERALKATGAPVTVSRTPPETTPREALVILTPPPGTNQRAMRQFGRPARLLIILPKWNARPSDKTPGFVEKAGLLGGANFVNLTLNPYSTRSVIARREGVTRPVLTGREWPVTPGAVFRLDRIDRLQTISGEGWTPAVTDEAGRAVVAFSRLVPGVVVVADPDILNNHGLARRENARMGLAVVEGMRGDRPVLIDVTQSGFRRGQGMLRLLLEPPWLAATLCGLATALLMGAHALGRFGYAQGDQAAYGHGRAALVENSAALVRMARKEAQMAPAYAELIWASTASASGSVRATGAERDAWLTDIARLRGLESPAALNQQAQKAKTRDDLLQVVRKIHDWKREVLGGDR